MAMSKNFVFFLNDFELTIRSFTEKGIGKDRLFENRLFNPANRIFQFDNLTYKLCTNLTTFFQGHRTCIVEFFSAR